jgi:hypothetical protein
MGFELIFANHLYVKDITVKPTFGGGTTNYSLMINADKIYMGPTFAENNIQKTYQINCKIRGFYLKLNNNGTNHFYFNDIIINYTPSSEPSGEQKQTKQVPQVFDIGNKVSETDEGTWGGLWYYYDSGCVLQSEKVSIDYGSSIFDGNLSTGLDHDFSTSQDTLGFLLNFPYPYYVNNITIKPKFKGNATKYTLEIKYNNLFNQLIYESRKEKVFQINGILDGIALGLSVYNENSSRYYFNDVIINYTPSSSSIDNYNEIQNQINKLNQDIISIKDDITDLKNTNLSRYNDTELRNKIDKLNQEIKSLKENVTKIKSNMSSEYNITPIKNNISHLNFENQILRQKLSNLTLKLEKVTSELEKLTEEIQNLEGTGVDEGSGQRDSLNQYTTNAIFIVILIILLLIILKLSMIVFKRKHQDIEEQRSDNILVGKITSEMLTNYRLKDTKLSNDEYKMLLERKFQAGKLSKDTYDYMKKFLNNLNKNQNIKTRKKGEKNRKL